jgi:hypothetical protein
MVVRRRRIAGLAASIALVGLCSREAEAQPAGFVYALQQVSGGPNQVYGFSVDPATGALTPLAGFPMNAGGTGFTLAPVEQLFFAGGHLHVLNDGDNTLSVFRVNRTTGALD